MRRALGQMLRKGKSLGHWVLKEFPKAPGLETYSRFIDRDNRALTSFLRSGGAEAWEKYVSSYHGWSIPKTIWIYWHEGEDHAPYLVRRCIQSWRDYNPDWDIKVLDEEILENYFITTKQLSSLPTRFTSNLLRLKVLADHGGVWADATTLCHRPLNEWLPMVAEQSGFFVFRGPNHDRWLDNWFIASDPRHPLINEWMTKYRKYVSGLQAKPDKYFMMIYVLQWSIIKNKALRQAFRSSGGLPAIPAFFLQAHLEGKGDLQLFKTASAKGLPLSKLNWKMDISEQDLKKSLDQLDI